MAFAQGQGIVVQFSLTKSGLRAFNVMATSGYNQTSPRNEVAFVVDGLVYSAPAFQASSFTGSVQITGNFTASAATHLADTINAARRGG